MDPISEGQSCSPEVEERACRGERNSSGGIFEKFEELQLVMEVEEHQFANLLESKSEQLERLKARNEELQKLVAAKMLELEEVESQIVKKEEDLQTLQVLCDLYKQALVTHYYEEMINKNSAQGDDPKCRLLEMTNSGTYCSGLVNVLSYGLEGEGIEHFLNRGEEFDEGEALKTLKVRKDLFIHEEVDAGGDGIEGGVQLGGSSHVDLRSPQDVKDGAVSRMAKVRRILFPEDIAVTRGGEVGAQAEKCQVGGKVKVYVIEHGELLEREASVSSTGTGDMADQISDSYIEAGSDEEDGDSLVLTQDLIQMLE